MDIKDVLSRNLKALMDYHAIKSQGELGRLSKIDQTTIGRMLNKKNAAQIDKIQAVAKVFDLDAWQMMVPNLDPSNPPVAQITAIERDLYERLRVAAEAFIIKK